MSHRSQGTYACDILILSGSKLVRQKLALFGLTAYKFFCNFRWIWGYNVLKSSSLSLGSSNLHLCVTPLLVFRITRLLTLVCDFLTYDPHRRIELTIEPTTNVHNIVKLYEENFLRDILKNLVIKSLLSRTVEELHIFMKFSIFNSVSSKQNISYIY